MKPLTEAFFVMLKICVATLVVLLIVPVVLQIVSRYTELIPTFMWTEEAARFCLIWTIMLGSSVAARENLHFDIDLLPRPRTKLGVFLSSAIVVLAIAGFGLAFLWMGTMYAWEARQELSEITEILMIWMYAAFPVAAVGWIVFAVEKLVAEARALRGR